MVVAGALDFPRALSQGFDLADARLIIAGALQELAQALLEEVKPLPCPAPIPTPRPRGDAAFDLRQPCQGRQSFGTAALGDRQ